MKSPRILVVDDEPRAVELLVRTLRKQAVLDTAATANEAWEKYQVSDFDLVISDQRMPGMSGIDLLSRIAEADPHVGRILLTGYSDLEATIEAINRGRVHAYLHKPCSPPDLQSTVKGVLDRVYLARENARLLANLDRARARIVAAERLAAIGKTTAMIVHDLRTPLTVLGSLSGQVSEAAAARNDGELGRIADQVDAELAGLRAMCDKLLDSTRLSEGGRAATREDLDDLVAAALATLIEPASRQGVRVEMQLESGVELEVDEDGLRRALRNLVTNSLEAMPDGGTLRVESACEGDVVVLRVSDTGGGIPEEIADRLFEPFVTCGKRGGTGLGLAVVQKVVDDHEGSVEVSKAEGGGTAFCLRLPLRRAI